MGGWSREPDSDSGTRTSAHTWACGSMCSGCSERTEPLPGAANGWLAIMGLDLEPRALRPTIPEGVVCVHTARAQWFAKNKPRPCLSGEGQGFPGHQGSWRWVCGP